MTIRLNRAHKTAIAEKARKLSPINAQLEELIEQRYDIANNLRIESLGGQAKSDEYEAIISKINALIDLLPEGILYHNSGIQINQYMRVKLEEGRWGDYVRFNKPMLTLNDTYVPPEDSIYLEQYNNSLDLEKQYRKQLQALQDTVYASIAGITTLKKLLDSWAEVVNLLPQELLIPKVQLPALQTTQLNKMIGLPVTKKAP